ncbi:hypothetical protein [Singulisphaera acidiphila]|uniref:hypothetical protein n=1 Tax=Singulisphaera acidiphila TaxID=466153 RepID=UPI00024735E8|nr:hypothetical protein [Singulisphaera acidiphila]
MVIHRASLTRLAVLFTLCYGTIVLGGSSLHAFVGCSLHTATLGADHAPHGKAASPGLSHACPLCHFLTQGQIPTERFIIACADLIPARTIDEAAVSSPLNAPCSTRPRAPPR